MSSDSILLDSNSEIEKKLEKLIDKAIAETQKKLDTFVKEVDYNERIIKEFGLFEYYEKIPDEICGVKDVSNIHVVMDAEKRKLQKLNDELTVAQLETYLNSLKTITKTLEEYYGNLQKEIVKYDNEYLKQCHGCSQDGFDFTSLENSIYKLQADIFRANEEQESKSIVTTRLSQCFDLHQEMTRCRGELDKLKSELSTIRHLPSNLPEAEKKLNELKKKFREVSNEFSKKVSQ